MNHDLFILDIIKKIESFKEGVISYGCKASNLDGKETWWEIHVSEYHFFIYDKRFRSFTKAWYKAAEVRKVKIVFVSSGVPKEKTLNRLAEEGNLIMNI